MVLLAQALVDDLRPVTGDERLSRNPLHPIWEPW
jgi:hypothetical protein